MESQGLSITSLQQVTTSNGTALSNLQQQAEQIKQTLAQHKETLSSQDKSINDLVAGQEDHEVRLSASEQAISSQGEDIAFVATEQGKQETRLTASEKSLKEALENIKTLNTTTKNNTDKINALESAVKGGNTSGSYIGLNHLFVVKYGEFTSPKLSMNEAVGYLHSLVSNGTIDQASVVEYAFGGLGSGTWEVVGTKTGWEMLGVKKSGTTVPVGLGVTATGSGSGGKGQQAVAGVTGQGAMASANHSHPYTFADVAQTFEDGSATVDATYVDDGNEVISVGVESTHPETGNVPVTSSTKGKLPFPARVDHRHPLNVVEKFINGAVAGNYVKPIGSSPSFGVKNYYARVDHVHTLDTSVGTPKASDSYPKDDNGRGGGTWKPGDNGIILKVITGIATGADGEHLLYYRELTFSKTGVLAGVSAEQGCVEILA